MKRSTRIIAGIALGLVGLLGPFDALAGKTVLRLRLHGQILEKPDDTAGLMALFANESVTTLRDWVTTIRKAGADANVAGLALIIEQPQLNLAQVEELTRALKQFKAGGKPVYCYLDYAGNASYALAAAATHITLAEYSELSIAGLSAELSYYKGLLDKIGVQMQMLHCGAYKSALEPFVRTEPSPEAAENINWLLDGIYQRWLKLMADGRNLPLAEVQALVDRAPLSAEDALKARLVDEVGTFESFRRRLHKEFGDDAKFVKKYEQRTMPELDTSNPFTLLPQIIEMFQTAAEPVKEPAVGLIFINGAIVVGKSESGPFSSGMAGSTDIRAAFDEAREDENIKAVVVRVDSPGGSAIGSDIIWNAATLCASRKPVIVSMGQVAGSGGYYVSIPADTIFAEASTITASIGVVGGKLIWSDLMENKLGITTTTFPRGAHAELMSMNRPWTPDELSFMEKYMADVYTQFKGRIMKSRGSKLRQDLESIAGGRVFTGAQALELGLVDQLGGLADALDLAASKAGLGTDYRVQTVPKPSEFTAFLELLQKLMGSEPKRDEFEVLAGRDPLLRATLPVLRQLAPDAVSDLLRALQQLVILRDERVGCFMPAVPRIR